MHIDQIFNAYVLSAAAAQYEVVSSCMEQVHNSTLLLKPHKVCTNALLLISLDSACQSRKEAHYLEVVAKGAKTMLELLHAIANVSIYALDLVYGCDRMADTKEETNSYTRFLHTSANKVFWEMTTGDNECIAYIVIQVLVERNMAADDDAKPKML